MAIDNQKICEPKDVAIKPFFLGPQTENSNWLRQNWIKIIDHWLSWRSQHFVSDGKAISKMDQESQPYRESRQRMDSALEFVLTELEQETTKFTPRYIGHMVSEISLPALLGHICTVLHNPNNTSREVSPVTTRFEQEAISDLAKMIGLSNAARGHFTSGGTIANFESLWRARYYLDLKLSAQLAKSDGNQIDAKEIRENYSLLNLGPWEFAKTYRRIMKSDFSGPVVLVPESRHYSWEKAVSLMGLGDRALVPIELDQFGRLSIEDLKRKMSWAKNESRPIAMIVSVAGTTEVGSVDPIGEVQDLVDACAHLGEKIWHHVDAAYGGYYTCMLDRGKLESMLDSGVVRSLKNIGRADSVTLDPHKLGYVPYACGAIIVKDADHYMTRQFAAAYLHQNNQSQWVSTIEGSRSGSGVTATWLANNTIGLSADGYGRLLSRGISAREKMRSILLNQIEGIHFSGLADLNILTFCILKSGLKLSEINRRTRAIYEKFEASPNFSISKTILKKTSYRKVFETLELEKNVIIDDPQLFLLRVVLMNPFIDTRESSVNYIEEFVAELKLLLTL